MVFAETPENEGIIIDVLRAKFPPEEGEFVVTVINGFYILRGGGVYVERLC